MEKKNGLKYIKFYLYLIIAIIIYFYYKEISLEFYKFLMKKPTLFLFYLNILSLINTLSILGILILSFLGSVFFLSLPSELIFIYFLHQNYIINNYELIVLVAFGNLFGMIFNYLIGLLLGKKFVKIIFKKNFKKYENIINNYGSIILFLGNILPGYIEIISVFYGSFKYDFKKYVIFTFLGRVIKFLILLYLYNNFNYLLAYI